MAYSLCLKNFSLISGCCGSLKLCFLGSSSQKDCRFWYFSCQSSTQWSVSSAESCLNLRGHRGNKLSKPVIFLDVDSPAISVCSCFFFAFRFCFCFVLSSFCDSYLRDGRLNTRYSTTSGSRTFFFGFKKKEKKG